MRRSLALAVVTLLGSSFCAELAAQSVVILSSGADARNCSMEAELAALRNLAHRGDVATCTRALEHSVLPRRDHAATLVNRGIILAAQEDYQAALDDYNKAMQVHPELPESYVSRGNLLYLAERYDDAIDDYDTALDLMLGRSHIALFNRGLARERKGDSANALADYQAALALQPEFAEAKAKVDSLSALKAP